MPDTSWLDEDITVTNAGTTERRDTDEEFGTIDVLDLKEVKLGRQGENNTQQVVIDCSEWLTDLPGCQLMVMAQRPGEKELYMPQVTASNGVITWPILSQDTALAGWGRAEVRGMLNGKIRKSCVFKTRIKPSLDGDGTPTPPTPPDWATEVINSVTVSTELVERAEELVEEATATAIYAVRYDTNQSLTDAQKATARGNAGAASDDDLIELENTMDIALAGKADAAATEAALAGKVDVAQGAGNAGKALVVGDDGNVEPDDVNGDNVTVEAGGIMVVPDYSQLRIHLTGTVTNNATWTENGSVTKSGEMYARFNGIGEYAKLFISGGHSEGTSKPLCVFYDANGVNKGAVYRVGLHTRKAAVGAEIDVPAGSSYVMVNGEPAIGSNEAINPDVYAQNDEWSAPSYREIQGDYHSGAAWKINPRGTAPGSEYCYTIYSDFEGHGKVYLDGIAYGVNYPMASFYDSGDTLLATYIKTGMAHAYAMELEIPAGASYLVVNGWLGANDPHTPKMQYILPQRSGGEGSQTLTECVESINESIEALEAQINAGRKILFVGDSYAEGYSHDGNNPGWCEYAAGDMGLGSDEYRKVYTGGYAFNNGTFTSLLAQCQDSDITDVVVCGGFNDRTATASSILSGISAFKAAAESRWPGVRVYVGFVAWIKAGSGSSAKDNWQEIREELTGTVLPAYQDCIKYGCAYLNNVEYWINDAGLTPTDGYHPSAEGNASIGKAVANAFRCGSAPLPYNDSLRLRAPRQIP